MKLLSVPKEKLSPEKIVQLSFSYSFKLFFNQLLNRIFLKIKIVIFTIIILWLYHFKEGFEIIPNNY
jgi:hypothetical protein